MPEVVDDVGRRVSVPAVCMRIVSIVPSLTESVAETARERLVGATAWCTHPGDLEVARVRGTKNPDVDAIVALRPDIVLANAEENRDPDLEALRHAGVPVYVTDIRTVDDALVSLGRMLHTCGLGRPQWLDRAARAWEQAGPVWPDGRRRRGIVPVWRRPWMAVGSDTFTGDVLRRLGVDNVLEHASERYPRVDVQRLPQHDLVVLPDEPYAFSATDGPEAFPGQECALVSGRLLTWYGPSMAEAVHGLGEQLRRAAVLA